MRNSPEDFFYRSFHECSFPLSLFHPTLLYIILLYFYFIRAIYDDPKCAQCTRYTRAINQEKKEKRRQERLNTFIGGRKKISPNRIKDVGACNFLEKPWSAFYIQRGDRKAHCSAAQHVYNRESTTPIALLPALATHRANTFQYNFIEFSRFATGKRFTWMRFRQSFRSRVNDAAPPSPSPAIFFLLVERFD